jgi:hypothetical protein
MIIMKKVILLFGLLMALQMQTRVLAQQTSQGNVVFTAYLNGAFNLIVVDGGIQTATFGSADDYNFGVSETQGVPGIDPGFSTVTMEATGNWYLKISAPDFTPTIGTGVIPINNLGVWCEATGVHQFGTEVICNHQSADNALGILNTDVNLIDLGTDDAGDQTDNVFILHWLMGTMQGSMNPASMFSQLAAGIFSQGTYNTTVVLTMTEIP